ncbi:MAG TPA: ATP-binding protein [Vicinamibacterales bacterium]
MGTQLRGLARGLLVFAPLALLGNETSAMLRYPAIGTAVLYSPYAFLTAALVVSRRRDWIWYILIGSAAHFVTHWPQWTLSWVVFADAANLARALVAALLLNRLVGNPPHLDSARSLTLFIVSAVVAAPAVGATIGAANVVLHGAATAYWQPWAAWFVSNALTGLATLPAAIVGFAYAVGVSRWHADRSHVIEALLLLIALAATCALAFTPGFKWPTPVLLLSAPLPILIWSALRFGPGGASASLTWITYSVIWNVDRGADPLLGSLDESILALQIFVLFTAAPVLWLAAIAKARHSVAQLHHALLASLEDHVAILDARGIVIEVNESWRRFAETPDAHTFQRVRPGDDYVAACQSSADRGDAIAAEVAGGVSSVLSRTRRRFEIEYDQTHGDHREAYAKRIEALERADGGAVVTRANVTARRQARVEIEEQRRELSHLARVSVLGQLSGAFAHELNQPLTAILSNAETARRVIRHDSPDLDYLGDILQDIIADDQRAAAMIQRLRGLLKRGDRRLQHIAIRDLIDEVLELARTELITRRVEVVTDINPALPPLWGDKVQLQQVMLNLILNACEAMGASAESGRRLVLTADFDAPGRVHLAIRDNGTGIAPELIDRLFEPFVTSKPDGLGLGLSISRTIVAAHGGRLWGQNNPGGGATMHCVLPVASDDAATLPVLAAMRDT